MRHLEEEKFYFLYMYYFNIFSNALRNYDTILRTFQSSLLKRSAVIGSQIDLAQPTAESSMPRYWLLSNQYCFAVSCSPINMASNHIYPFHLCSKKLDCIMGIQDVMSLDARKPVFGVSDQGLAA